MLYKVVSIPIYIERFFFEEQDPPVFNSSAILATVALTGFHLDGDSGLHSTTVRAKRRSTGPAAPPCPRFWHHRCLLASTEKVVAATMVQKFFMDGVNCSPLSFDKSAAGPMQNSTKTIRRVKLKVIITLSVLIRRMWKKIILPEKKHSNCVWNMPWKTFPAIRP